MSIYSTVTAHNTQLARTNAEPVVVEDRFTDPLTNIVLADKGTTLAGQAVPHDDLAEYFSDDEEREKALQQQKKDKLQKDRDT